MLDDRKFKAAVNLVKADAWLVLRHGHNQNLPLAYRQHQNLVAQIETALGLLFFSPSEIQQFVADVKSGRGATLICEVKYSGAEDFNKNRHGFRKTETKKALQALQKAKELGATHWDLGSWWYGEALLTFQHPIQGGRPLEGYDFEAAEGYINFAFVDSADLVAADLALTA